MMNYEFKDSFQIHMSWNKMKFQLQDSVEVKADDVKVSSLNLRSGWLIPVKLKAMKWKFPFFLSH